MLKAHTNIKQWIDLSCDLGGADCGTAVGARRGGLSSEAAGLRELFSLDVVIYITVPNTQHS